MKRLLIIGFACLIMSAPQAFATPGQYALRAKIGPSFKVQDFSNGFKVGGEFDYEFGYGFGFNLSSNFNLNSTFVFEFIPALKYDIVYFIPGTLFVLAGAGYQAFDFEDQGLGVRLGTGMVLPLKKPFEFVTDINLVFTPSGVPGTPVVFDWLTGFGVRY